MNRPSPTVDLIVYSAALIAALNALTFLAEAIGWL